MCSLPKEKDAMGTSLAVQWLRRHASSAGAMGLITGRGTKIPHAVRRGQRKKEKRKECHRHLGDGGRDGVEGNQQE